MKIAQFALAHHAEITNHTEAGRSRRKLCFPISKEAVCPSLSGDFLPRCPRGLGSHSHTCMACYRRPFFLRNAASAISDRRYTGAASQAMWAMWGHHATSRRAALCLQKGDRGLYLYRRTAIDGLTEYLCPIKV